MGHYYKVFSVGRREPCGHHHRTRSGAERCARIYLNANPDILIEEAEEKNLTLTEYKNKIINEGTGDCFIAKITD